MPSRSAFTCCMCHQPCSCGSALAASSSASSRRLPRVGALISTAGSSTRQGLQARRPLPRRYPLGVTLEPLLDGHGRRISDLRVSVTDRCNFRCQYCMPAEGLPWLERDEILSFEEIERLVAAARARWASTTCASPAASRWSGATSRAWSGCCAAVPGVRDLSLTTNGYLLERDAEALVRGRGSTRVNVSIDSLQRDRFFQITRRDALPQVLRGLEAIAALPRGAPDQGQRRRDARVHRGGGPALRASSPAPPPSRSASSSSCRSTATTPGRRTRCSPATRSARSCTPSTRSRRCRASRTPPRASSASPTGAASSASSTPCPSPSAPTATASG